MEDDEYRKKVEYIAKNYHFDIYFYRGVYLSETNVWITSNKPCYIAGGGADFHIKILDKGNSCYELIDNIDHHCLKELN